MPSTFTEHRIEKIGFDEQSNTWGSTTNTNWELIEDMAAGLASLSLSSGTYTLSTNNGATDEARKLILDCTGTLSGNVTIEPPGENKAYFIRNATTGDHTVSVQISGGSSVEIAQDSGTYVGVVTDGTDCYPVGSSSPSNFLPPGMIAPYTASSAPTGWLLCAGQAVSRTTYANLFEAIGTTYGSGNGSTTFNLPDLRGRVIAGRDNMGGSSANRLTSGGSGIGLSLGDTGGEETVTLTEGQLASHSHEVAEGIFTDNTLGGTQNRFTVVNHGSPSEENNFNSETVGNDEAHQNTQPTMVLQYIIKT